MNLIKDIRGGLNDLECNRKQITYFAIIISLIFIFITYLYNWPNILNVITAISIIILALVRFINWKLLITPFKIWMGLALFIGWFVMRFILIAVFVLIIFPIGLIFKISGKDPMGRFKKESYWYKMEETIDSPRYLKKF